jgi:hypothetical protein
MANINVSVSDGLVLNLVSDSASEAAARVAQAFTGPLYADTAAGLAATADNDGFAVDNGDGTAGVYLNDGGVAVLVRTIIIDPANEGTAALLGRTGGGTVQDFIDSIPLPNAFLQITATTYTLTPALENATILLTNANPITLTLPPKAEQNIDIGAKYRIIQGGAGVVNFTPGAGVTLQARVGDSTAGQGAVAEVTKIANNTFVVSGDVV